VGETKRELRGGELGGDDKAETLSGGFRDENTGLRACTICVHQEDC